MSAGFELLKKSSHGIGPTDSNKKRCEPTTSATQQGIARAQATELTYLAVAFAYGERMPRRQAPHVLALADPHQARALALGVLVVGVLAGNHARCHRDLPPYGS